MSTKTTATSSEAHTPQHGGFNPDDRWQLHPRVALRPEPFGAMAYHYDNRRLNFLRSFDLVDLVKALADYPTVREAFAASSIDASRWPSYEKALAALAASDFLVVGEDPA